MTQTGPNVPVFLLSHCFCHLFVHIARPSLPLNLPCLASDVTVGLPVGVLVACGLALLLLVALASWKLCWVPWRNKSISSSSALSPDDCPPSLQPEVGNIAGIL